MLLNCCFVVVLRFNVVGLLCCCVDVVLSLCVLFCCFVVFCGVVLM